MPSMTQNRTATALPCDFEGCVRRRDRRTWCVSHYRQHRQGLPLKPLEPRQSRKGAGCSHQGCKRRHYRKGFCTAHDKQMREQGFTTSIHPVLRHLSVSEFMEYAKSVAEVTDAGCWVWPFVVGNHGYGTFKRRNMAHRTSYEVWIGPVPDGTVVHHKCARRTCFNPAHLQATTFHDNLAEMMQREAYEAEIARLKARVAELESRTCCS